MSDDYDFPDIARDALNRPFDEPRREKREPPKDNGFDHDEADFAGLAEALSAATWIKRDIPPPDRLLGDLVTTTCRAFIVGQTGLGKTMFGLAVAMGMAFGTGFLHWRSARPARVLYIDGEMPGELLRQRIADAARQIDREDLLGNLMAYSTDDAERLAALYPKLGMIEPLNTEPGQNFMRALCIILKPDTAILDNVQSLLAGVQKEEETWVPTLSLVAWLTSKRIGQVWIDHTGHASERQYGTSTKSWRFDTVGTLTPLAEEQRQPRETAFTLSFGKARRRTPDNWQEFEPHIIRLRDDVWTSEPVDKGSKAAGGLGNVSPSRTTFYDALVAVIGKSTASPGRTTLPTWELECLRRNLIERPPAGKEDYRQRDARYRNYRKAKAGLLGARWIAIEDDWVIDLKGRWT